MAVSNIIGWKIREPTADHTYDEIESSYDLFDLKRPQIIKFCPFKNPMGKLYPTILWRQEKRCSNKNSYQGLENQWQ